MTEFTNNQPAVERGLPAGRMSREGGHSRFLVITMLACQQYLAIALICSALPVMLRYHGASLELVGLFSMAFFAFAINFLWAPLVDRYSLGRLGLRRSWILSTQAAGAAVVAVLACLDPAADFLSIFIGSLVLASLAATQRIATLGYAAEVLSEAERPFGTAMLGWGAAVGHAVGGAVCLQLLGVLGWRSLLLGFALVLLASSAFVFVVPEPVAARERFGPVVLAPRWTSKPGHAWKGARPWGAAAVTAPATFGLAVCFAMLSPRLVDTGFAVSQIGWILALANVVAFTLIAALTSRVIARGAPQRAVTVACIALALCFAALWSVGGLLGDRGAAVATASLVFVALAVQHVAFNTWFLALARPGEAATDVTCLTSALAAFALGGFAASGLIAARFGYGATLMLAAAGYAISALLMAWQKPARTECFQVRDGQPEQLPEESGIV